MSEQIKVTLTEDELPRQWYNLNADFAKPMPPPVGMDGNPIGPEALAPVFPMNLIEQEMCTDRWVDIPEDILGYYKIWRPTRSTAPAAWKRRSAPPPRSTTKTKAFRRPARTSPTPPWPRRGTTSNSASRSSPPKPAPASGARPFRSPVRSSAASSARSSWCGSASTKNHSAR